MFKGIRAVTYRQKLFVQLILIFSFLLSSNGLMPRYLLEIFSIDNSFVKGLYTLLIVLTVIVWLVDSNFFRKSNRIFSDGKKLWLPLLYLFYIVGVFLSTHTDLALRSLERHMAILLVPLMIYSEKRILMINSELIFKWFRTGVLISQLMMLTLALINSSGLFIHEMMYNNLAVFNHPSYLAIASTLSLILAYRELYEARYSKWTIIEVIMNIAFILLFNSKSGILCLLLLLIAITLRKLTNGWSGLKKSIAGIVSILLLVALIFGVSKYNRRFGYALRSLTFESLDYPKVLGSTETRRAVWSLTPEIIDGKWLFGQGTGDIDKHRLEIYKKFGFKAGYESKINSHNQFIEIFVTLGLFALILFIGAIIIAWVKCKGNFYSLLILSLFLINFLFESMLERQSGILMFTCFYGMIFILSKPLKLK